MMTTAFNMEPANEAIFIQLEKSVRNFHSHHWFHIAEFFLYKPLSQPILNGNNKTVIILPPSSNFLNQLTPMSIFFLLVSLPVLNLNRVIILNPKSITKSVSTSNNISYHNNQNYFNYFLTDSKQYSQYQHYFWMNKPISKKNNTSYPNKVLQLSPSSSSSTSEYSLSHNSIISIPKSFTSTDIQYHFGKYPQDTRNWLNSSSESDIIRNRISYLCKDYNKSLILENKNIKYWTFKNNVLTRFNPIDSLVSGTSNKNITDTKRLLKLVVYQRDINRHFHHLRNNLQHIFEQLSTLQPVILTNPVIMNQSNRSDKIHLQHQQQPQPQQSTWLITIIRHNEKTQPCDLYCTLQEADLYLTTHGFQAMCKL